MGTGEAMAISRDVLRKYIIRGVKIRKHSIYDPAGVYHGYCNSCDTVARVPYNIAYGECWDQDESINCASCGERLGCPFAARSYTDVRRISRTDGTLITF